MTIIRRSEILFNAFQFELAINTSSASSMYLEWFALRHAGVTPLADDKRLRFGTEQDSVI